MQSILLIATIAILLFHSSAWASDDGFFPILPWDSLRGWDQQVKGFSDPLESVADCNFTVAGFVQPEQLPTCERLGLKAIVSRPTSNKPGFRNWFGDTDAQIDAAIKRRVEQAGKSEAVIGYFIIDEPGVARFPILAKVVAAVKKHAPGKIAYINLFPGYATIGSPNKSQLGTQSYPEYLERFATEVKPDIISYDNYKVMTSDNLQNRESGSSFFYDLIEVRKAAQAAGIPFWNVVCSNRIRPYTTVPSPANLLLQAYATLAAGGRGLAWYTYYERGYAYAPIDANGTRTNTWFYLQMVNRQIKTLGPIMNRLTSTGVFFTKPPGEGMPTLPGKLVQRVDSRASVKGFSSDSPAIMVGEFEGKDGDYVMLVNIDLAKSANITLHTRKTYAAKQVISAVDGHAEPIDETNGHWLVPGAGVLVRLVASEKRG
jgi:hypothetical protein